MERRNEGATEGLALGLGTTALVGLFGDGFADGFTVGLLVSLALGEAVTDGVNRG